MKRFLAAAGVGCAVSVAYASVVTWVFGPFVGLMVGLWVSVITIPISGALFYLAKRLLPIRWYTRLSCAILSVALSAWAFMNTTFLASSGAEPSTAYAVNLGIVFAMAPLLLALGIAFGVGAGQNR